jgi:L-lactate dehydrogenase complex protein LldG
MSGNTQQASHKSTSARNNILAKLKQQVEGADYKKLPQEVGYQYPIVSKKAQLDQFVSHLETNHAVVIKLTNEDIPNVITEQLKQRGISSLLMGKNGPCEALKLDRYVDASITINDFDFNLFESQENKDKLFDNVPASITHSVGAIAATGTVVLWPTIEEPRSLSLVPPLHIVVVDAENLYSDFASLITAQQWKDNLPTNAVLLSGPSKTADIQQTLAYGAHGPKELIVLLTNG